MKQGWKHCLLGDALTFQRGFDITKKEQRDGPYKVISSSGPKSTHVDYKAKGPGVVIGRKGTLGSVFYTEEDYWPHDTSLWIKDFHGNDPKFAYYFLQTMGFEKFDVGASNPSLNRNHIHIIPVDYPDLPTQRKIAGILSAYDDLIENNLRRIKILEEMAQSLYREWFVHFRFPGHESVPRIDSPLGEIPKGWEVKSLGDTLDFINQVEVAGPHLDSVPYLPIDCLPRKSLAVLESRPGIEAQSSLIRFKKHDILFGAMRCYFHKVVIAPFDGTTRKTCFVLRPRVSSDYSWSLLTLFKDETVEYASNHSKGSTIPYATWIGSLAEMQTLKPDSELTSKFHRLAWPMLERIAQAYALQDNLRRTRDLLLPKLLNPN